MVRINSLSQFNSGAPIISCRCFGRQKIISMAAHHRATTASCRRCSAAYLLPMAALARAAYQPVGTDAAVRIWPETPFGARDRRARRDPTLRDCSAASIWPRSSGPARTRRIDSVGRGIDGRVSRMAVSRPNICGTRGGISVPGSRGRGPATGANEACPDTGPGYRDRESGGAAGGRDRLIRTMGRTVASPMTALDRSRSNGYCDCRRHQNVQGTQPTSLTPLESFDVDRNCEVV